MPESTDLVNELQTEFDRCRTQQDYESLGKLEERCKDILLKDTEDYVRAQIRVLVQEISALNEQSEQRTEAVTQDRKDLDLPNQERAAPAKSETPTIQRDTITLLQSQLINVFYDGKFQEALKLCATIRNIDPYNATAIEYAVKAEDYIQRNVIFNSLIPREAKEAYLHGVSALRKDELEPARILFESAVQIAADTGIGHFQDAEQALLEVEVLIRAKVLREEAEIKLSEDNWEEARKRLRDASGISDDLTTRSKLEMLDNLMKQEEIINSNLFASSATTTDAAQSISKYLALIRQETETLPKSKRLRVLLDSTIKSAQEVCLKLRVEAEHEFERAVSAAELEDQIHILEDALTAIEGAHDLCPSDVAVKDVRHQIKKQTALVTRAKQDLIDAERYIQIPDEGSLELAKKRIEALVGFAGDLSVQSTAKTLFGRLLAQSRIALNDDNFDGADEWLAQAVHVLRDILDAGDLGSDKLKELRNDLDARVIAQQNRIKFKRAMSAVQNGQMEEAVATFEEILATDPASELFQFHYRQALTRNQKEQELKQCLVKGIACLQARDSVGAKEALEKALSLKPEDTEIHRLYTEALIMKGRQDKGWSSLSVREKAQLVLAAALVVITIALTTRILF